MRQKKYILALILLLYPLRHVMTGLDLMDAGYALGNYKFFDTMNETWKFATYLSNVIGMLLMNLPFGSTWIGMNLYTSLLIGITAAMTYLFIVNKQPNDNKKEILLFLAELGALSLGIAPSVILYHYLGYILMTVASLILYTAITKDDTRCFIVAGVILGLCVAVRMPNITYMAFILPLCYYWFKRRKEDNWGVNLIKRTLYCLCGYIIGIFVPIGYISIRYGITKYPNMVNSLFDMTESATDYKPTSMLSAMFGDYLNYGVWIFAFLIYIMVGIIFFTIMNKIFQKKLFEGEIHNKIIIVFKTLYAFGILVVLRFCYGRGMFGLDYTEYFSMYKWLAVYLVFVIFLCIWTLSTQSTDNNLKLWSVFLLVTIFITPLGSNNGLYTIINNLFLVAPLSLLLICEFYEKTVDKFYVDTRFVVKTVTNSFMICVFIVSLLFGINFVFHDKPEEGSKRVCVSLKFVSPVNGILTTASKKEDLESLGDFICNSGLVSKKLLTYGNIPALSYIFNMQPAIFTTWGDLDSNSLSRIETELGELEGYPVIILGVESVDNMTDESTLQYKKLHAIESFMYENNYEQVYENSEFRVYYTN